MDARGRYTFAAAAAMLAVASLTACTPASSEPTPDKSAAPAVSTESPATTAPTPAPQVFTEPRTCTELLGPVLEAEIQNGGYELFSSTAGSGKHYPIASNQSGATFSCWYGVDQVDLSSFEIAARKLGPGDMEGIGAGLAAKGFASTPGEGVTTWSKDGTTGGEPAIVHVVRPDSWLTAYSEYGGATQVATLTQYLATVADTLYN